MYCSCVHRSSLNLQRQKSQQYHCLHTHLATLIISSPFIRSNSLSIYVGFFISKLLQFGDFFTHIIYKYYIFRMMY